MICFLFKFTTFSNFFFQMANHELKGLMAYFRVRKKDLNLPLLALVDYRGFRLVTLSVLPVSRQTLIYGTCDGGQTIVNKVEEFSGMMAEMSGQLNLKRHVCGAKKGKTMVLDSAADVEGHLGLDEKFYLLDFSRTMPPVRPDPRFFFFFFFFFFFCLCNLYFYSCFYLGF